MEEIKENKKPKIELEYYRARFTQKCGAILLDTVVFVLLCLGLFIGCKEIVEITPTYIDIDQKFETLKLDSGLYVENKDLNRVEDIVTFLNRDDKMSSSEKEEYLLEHIYTFFDSVPSKTEYLKKEYEDFILNLNINYEGYRYFIYDETKGIIKNPDFTIPIEAYVDNVYKSYIDNIGLAEFIILTPNALDYQKYQSNMLLFVEIPVSFLISATIVWYIIPLCFTRGKKTLGRLAFRIGILDSNKLNVKAGRFTIRFLIFLFLELILSVFTLCVPLIISISMSAFTKKKQNFHDYMLGIEEVDTYNTKIYKDNIEISKDFYKKEPIDFRQR